MKQNPTPRIMNLFIYAYNKKIHLEVALLV